MELDELVHNAGKLVSLPEIYYRAQELLDDPHAGDAAIGKVLETDTGLSARLLRIANSPFYGLPGRIDRVSYAVTLLGRNRLRDLILSTVILRTFKNISPRLVDLSTFWHHSLYCGLAAKQLGKLKGLLHDERMLVAGVVHDIGQLLLYQMQPDHAREALGQAEPADDGMFRAELAVFGYTHADVGAALLQSWHLPESLQEAVACHHEPWRAREYALEASLLHLGNALANRMEPGRAISECRARIDPCAWEVTGFSEDIAEPVLIKVNEQFLQTLDILMPGINLR